MEAYVLLLYESKFKQSFTNYDQTDEEVNFTQHFDYTNLIWLLHRNRSCQ